MDFCFRFVFFFCFSCGDRVRSARRLLESECAQPCTKSHQRSNFTSRFHPLCVGRFHLAYRRRQAKLGHAHTPPRNAKPAHPKVKTKKGNNKTKGLSRVHTQSRKQTNKQTNPLITQQQQLSQTRAHTSPRSGSLCDVFGWSHLPSKNRNMEALLAQPRSCDDASHLRSFFLFVFSCFSSCFQRGFLIFFSCFWLVFLFLWGTLVFSAEKVDFFPRCASSAHTSDVAHFFFVVFPTRAPRRQRPTAAPLSF